MQLWRSIEAKPTRRTTGATFLASFSLFWSSGSKKQSAEQEANTKMADETAKNMSETIQHSDQLFDENNFQEAYDLLQKSGVSKFV